MSGLREAFCATSVSLIRYLGGKEMLIQLEGGSFWVVFTGGRWLTRVGARLFRW